MKVREADRHRRHLQVVELYDLGLSIEGIAEVLGVHKDTVYWHVRRERVRQERLAETRGEENDQHRTNTGRLSHSGASPAIRNPLCARDAVKP